MWSYPSSFHVPFVSCGPKIVEKSAFLQFCVNLNKKSDSIKAIYICATGRSRNALSENVLLIMIWFTVLEVLGFEVGNFC